MEGWAAIMLLNCLGFSSLSGATVCGNCCIQEVAVCDQTPNALICREHKGTRSETPSVWRRSKPSGRSRFSQASLGRLKVKVCVKVIKAFSFMAGPIYCSKSTNTHLERLGQVQTRPIISATVMHGDGGLMVWAGFCYLRFGFSCNFSNNCHLFF